MNEPATNGSARDPFLRRVVLTVVVIVSAVALVSLAWLTIEIWLVVFGGVLMAVILRSMSVPLAERLKIPHGWSLTLVIVLLSALLAGAWLLFSPILSRQMGNLAETLPLAISQLKAAIATTAIGRMALESLGNALYGPGSTQGLRTLLLLPAEKAITFTLYSLTAVFTALFVAGDARLYTEGMARLLPLQHRDRARAVIAEMGHTLRWFLIGRIAAMALVGLLTAIELWLLGVPLAALLGLQAAVLTFIPYIGPIASAIPIGLVTLTHAPGRFLLAIGIYTVIQNLEDYLILPLVQHRTVQLPPAVTLVVQVLMGLLFGWLGIAMATPLAAIGLVFLHRVYQEGVLGDRTA
jgi:predicted PurR-regulated permease PerM